MGLVIVGGLTLATVISLFVIPVVYILIDRAVIRVTGHGSAHGLKKAQDIERETAREDGQTEPAR
jgi:multidrug efflux pump